MFFSTDDVSTLWALMWSWVVANNPLIIVVLLTVGLVLPVVFLATKTIARSFCQHHDISASVLPVAVLHHGETANALHGDAPSAVKLRSGIEMLEEGLPVSSASLPPTNILQMMFPNIQPAPCASELRMLRTLKAMYIMLGQTLDGATNSLSSVERMNAACSLVSRTIATLGSWRAPASVVALLQPAKDVTDLFSRRSTKNGSGAMSKGRQAHYVALLKKRAQIMEEVLAQALWTGTMPTVSTKIQDAVPIIALAEKVGTIGHKKSNTTCKVGGKGKAAITSGVQYVPYRRAFRLADSRVLQ